MGAGELPPAVPARTGGQAPGGQAPPTGQAVVRARARPRMAPGSRRLVRRDRVRRARVRSPGIPKTGPPAVRPRTERAGTTGRRENVAARSRARVTDRGARRARREDHGQPARAAGPGPRAVPVRTVSPAAHPGPRRGTGRGGPRPAATSAGPAGPGPGRAGPPMATVHHVGEQAPPAQAPPAQAGPRRAPVPA